MPAAKSSFTVGDIVVLKGQRHPMTVTPPPQGHPQPEKGWTWTVRSSEQGGVMFSLLHVDTLVKRAAR